MGAENGLAVAGMSLVQSIKLLIHPTRSIGEKIAVYVLYQTVISTLSGR